MYLGIDLGTSALKALVMNKEGKVLKTISKEYPVNYFNENWAEQDPNHWWEACKNAIKEIGQDKKMDIEGISFSGQMHGLVILDKQDNILRPAILWCDQRTQKQCDYLESLDINIKKITGNQVLTGFTAPKILWVMENEPEIFKRIDKIMLPKDYLIYKLSKIHATDISDASGTSILDIENKKWSEDILKELKISIDTMPKIYESYEKVGKIDPELATQLNISKDIDIIAGGSDQAVGGVGVGAVEEGIISLALGTSGVVFSSVDKYITDDEYRLHSFCHSNGKYHQMGVMLSAAASYKWWVEGINSSKDYEKFNESAAAIAAGSNSLFFLPYLMGERTPHNDTDARGTFIGMTPIHTNAHMTRSVLEGVTYALRDSLELLKNMNLPINKIRVSGGGGKSKLWKQILADVFNTEIISINSTEGPAYGAAILASVGCGCFTDVNEACKKIIQEVEVISPSKDVKLYEERYQIFKKIYPALKDIFKII